MAIISGKTKDGETVVYTGKAGPGWVSPNVADAFDGYSIDGARAKAVRLNAMTALHGITFSGGLTDAEHADLGQQESEEE
jgi:hypothetical protein